MSTSSATLLSPRVLIPFALVTLIWGSTWIVIKGQLGIVPPSWSVTYRFLTAGICMAGWALWKRESWRLGMRGYGFAILLGLLQFCGNFNFVYRAEQHVTSGLVAVMFGTRWLAMLYGFAFLSHQIGGFLGAWLGGVAFERTGSYDLVWWLSVLFGIASALLNLPIVEKPVDRLARV